MKKAQVFIFVGFFGVICAGAIWKYSERGAQYSLIKRSLSDQALSVFDSEIKALTRKQVALQQAEVDSELLKIAKADAKLRSEIESIPFWFAAWRNVFYSLLIVGCFMIVSTTCSACLIFVRRRSLVSQTFGASVVTLPYSQINKETGAIRLLQTALTQISQGTLDKEDLFRLFQVTRGNHGAASQRMIDVTPTVPAPALATGSPVPQFRQILEGLHEGDPMTLGYGMDGSPNMGTFERIFSCGIFGLSKSGKTTGLIGLVCQSLLTFPEVHYTVIDPHRKRTESLTAGLPKTPHFTLLNPDNFRAGVYAFNRELERRIEKDEDFSARPYVLLIDELPVVIRHEQGASVKALLSKIAAEGRKVGIYCLISGQDTRLTGAGDARDLLCSSMAYRLSKKQARYLLDDDTLVTLHKAVREAKVPGLCLFNPTDDMASLMQQPRCLPQDVAWIETRLKHDAQLQTVSSTVSDGRKTDIETPETPHEAQGSQLSPILQKVMDYMEQHDLSLSAFCKSAGMEKSKGGLSYMLKGERSLSNEMALKLIAFFEEGGETI